MTRKLKQRRGSAQRRFDAGPSRSHPLNDHANGVLITIIVIVVALGPLPSEKAAALVGTAVAAIVADGGRRRLRSNP
ncbi:hypothetical protein OG787_29115 [Streptomyces sp. NBC_00075]|uniref:hypothetical protein n=1 Tax=Streptomyces sp. NBC_00075 TaxID=2975641 RepID=UPI00324BD05D